MTTLYGNSKDGKVFVDDYDACVHGICTCLCCEGQLRAKRGKKVIHHFAHMNREACDSWSEGQMTQWHKDWQLLVPPECREVRMSANGETHIADIKLPTGLVVEVQHSPMTDYEAKRREKFYGGMIWIVDGLSVVKQGYGNGDVGVFVGGKDWWMGDRHVLVDTRWGLFDIYRMGGSPRKRKWVGVRSSNLKLRNNRFFKLSEFPQCFTDKASEALPPVPYWVLHKDLTVDYTVANAIFHGKRVTVEQVHNLQNGGSL